VLERGLVPERERGLVPERVLAPERERVLGLAQESGLGLHRQPNLQLTTTPAGLTIFSFSLIYLLLKYLEIASKKFLLKAITSLSYIYGYLSYNLRYVTADIS